MAREIKMLLKPIQVGPLLLKNRMVKSPTWTILCSAEGEVTQRMIDHYINIARGGVGMIMLEAASVDGRHTWVPTQLRIDDYKFLPGLNHLVEAVHQQNVPILCQLVHPGVTGRDPVTPSDVPSKSFGATEWTQPRAMTLAEVEETRDLFIEAAVRAKGAGFDGVTIHTGASYLLGQFLSPRYNKRTDKYGGTLENRMLLCLEIVQGIRRKCGPDFLLGHDMIWDELVPDGAKPEHAIAFAKRLEEEGVTFINGDLIGNSDTFYLPEGRGLCMRQKKGVFDIAGALKKEVSTLIFARTRGEGDPNVWEEAIEKGQCDAVMAARPLLCDPELPKKLSEGRRSDVRLCIRCNHCYENIINGFSVGCSLNPELGREAEYAIQHTDKPKKVLIAGGGPAGLEAARIAALRGHRVMVMEKGASLGGNLVTASLPIGKDGMKTFVDWQEHQCRQAGVKIELNREVTPEVTDEVKPDVVIIATGATPLVPPIPGVKKPHVVLAADVLAGKASVGKRVVVVGGGMVGTETAELIAERGLAEKVTLIEMLPEIAADMDPMNKGYMFLSVIPRWRVEVITNMKIEEITDKGVVAVDKAWKRHNFGADTVVLAVGYTPNQDLYESLKGRVEEIYIIGDSLKPRKLWNATTDGAHVARQI